MVEVLNSGKLLSYERVTEPVRFTLVAWDHDEYSLTKKVVPNNQRESIVVPWENRDGSKKHTNVLKLAAYVENGRCQAGTVFVTLQRLKEVVLKRGCLTIEHAFSPVCAIDLEIEKADMEALDAAIAGSEMSRVYDIKQLNEVTDRICSHVLECIDTLNRKLDGRFLPASTGADEFKNMKTLLPVYMDGNAMKLNMAHLQTTVSGRGKSVSLPVVMYLVHAACLCDGIESMADISTAHWQTRFRLYTRAVTLITADESYDEYTGDKAPIGVRPQCLASGEQGVAFEFMDTENIQVPFTQCNERGEDCEDWAMAILFLALALRYHAHHTVPKLVNRSTKNVDEKAIMALELPIADFDLEKRVALLHKVMSLGSDKALEVNLCTVTAVARSAQLDESHAVKPCGHECCMAMYNSNDGTQKAAKVLEGTNWVDNTDEYTEQQCKIVCGHVIQRVQELRADGVRMNMMQRVDCFYKSIFAIDKFLVMTIDETICKPVTFGACASDVIATLTGEGSRAFLHKIGPGGNVNKDQFEEYIASIDNISDEVQPPGMTDAHWAMRMKTWGQLPAEPPADFRGIHVQRELFSSGDKSAPLYGLFSSRNKVKGSFPFMSVHVSVVAAPQKPLSVHELCVETGQAV